MTTADVSVRVAWAQDAPGIAGVQARAWAERYDDLPALLAERGLDASTHAEAWHASLSRPPEARHRALVALERVRVVGFVLTGPATDPDADPAVDGELSELTVDPAETRRGHGSRLLQAAVDTLAADAFTRIVCWLDTTDDTARTFLTSAGWAPDGATRELADESGTGTVKQVRLHAAIG
ncbi:GNAT family N-acetyltransferase [Nocardioides stalactiti]|uniref:GNAT family N-acetyltransferase n=1 Tax=Nocardioides stalactiti TaxID=2755356 RepID=UPI0016021E6F|nr:GNAT family N-acetyltransferase [Nocardioides stalactiti]